MRMLNKYHFQLRIHTMAKCMTGSPMEDDRSFTLGGLKFEPWNSYLSDWHQERFWLASSEIEAHDVERADKIFTQRTNQIIPRIAFISQCYTEYIGEPLLIQKEDHNVVFLDS